MNHKKTKWATINESFPGTLATNVVLIVIGLLMCGLSFYAQSNVSSLLGEFGAAMFIAGTLAIVNIIILSNELGKSGQQLETLAYVGRMKSAGINDVFSTRGAKTLNSIISAVEKEKNEIVIVGSSLKGIIGLGFEATGDKLRLRNAIFSALKRNVELKILMTNPEYAHFRATQEGRRAGDIESEILKNVIYLSSLKFENQKTQELVSIKLFNGTPTIFLFATSKTMLINPYPYFTTAFNSYTFEFTADSEVYQSYYESHYNMAWSSKDNAIDIDNDNTKAFSQIKHLIEKKSNSNAELIPSKEERGELLMDLEKALVKHKRSNQNE